MWPWESKIATPSHSAQGRILELLYTPQNTRRRCAGGRGGKTWVKLADAFSWMSLLGKGSTKELVHFIWHCWVTLRCTVHEHDTYRIFSEKLRISYECIWTGEWRDRDMNGNLYQRGTIGWNRYHRMKRLADDYFGIIWNMAADLDFHASFYGAPRVTPRRLLVSVARSDKKTRHYLTTTFVWHLCLPHG